MRIHLVAAMCVGVAGSTIRFAVAERLALLLCVFLVVSAEVANSALEALVDLVTRERHELARVAKDAGAGAVLVLAAGSVVVVAIVALHAAPAIAAAQDAVARALAIAALLAVVMGVLLVGFRRPGAVDVVAAAAGAMLLVRVALSSVDAVFTVVAALAFAVSVAVAFARPR